MNFRDLREQLTDEAIKNILAQFNVEPVTEDEASITFPTCCHNLEGGSPKLIYYKNTKLFHCYTECAASFDIFNLLQKMYRLRGKEITLKQAVEVCDLDASEIKHEDLQLGSSDDIRYMQELNNVYIPNVDAIEFKTYDRKVLRQYAFDYDGQLIGIRARYFRPEDIKKGKYRPVYYNGTLYNHPTGRTFYGIFENHKNIERKKTVVIFEGKR